MQVLGISFLDKSEQIFCYSVIETTFDWSESYEEKSQTAPVKGKILPYIAGSEERRAAKP